MKYILSILLIFNVSFSQMNDFHDLKQKAENGDTDAQSDLGVMYAKAQNYPEALKWYKLAAKKGNRYAQYNLGHAYYSGQGIRQNKTEALKWFKLSAEQRNSYAQYNLGVMYEKGDGVRKNKSIAKEWYGRACDNGHQGGCEGYRDLNK